MGHRDGSGNGGIAGGLGHDARRQKRMLTKRDQLRWLDGNDDEAAK